MRATVERMNSKASLVTHRYVNGAVRRVRRAKAIVTAAPRPRAAEGPRFSVRVKRDTLDGGWIAEIVQMPGCMSQGETREEAVDNVIEALREILVARFAHEVQTHPRRAAKKTQTYDLAVR